MDKDITISRKYEPAMMIKDQAEADAYFNECVEHTMQFATTREQAEKIERESLGYFAGYYDNETRERVERLFNCEHPYFGKISVKGPPTMEEAFQMGFKRGKASRK
jgi:hypothetical protein